jgi:hypothetical protein
LARKSEKGENMNGKRFALGCVICGVILAAVSKPAEA